MNAWPFVIAAYGLTGLGTLCLTAWAWLSMRSAEAEAAALTRQP